jgi:DNA-binding protein H-NS
MAKKARRGRPPGSKNKKAGKGTNGSVTRMDVGQLRSYIDSLHGVLAKKVSEQRAYFEDQLSQLTGYASKKTAAAAKTATPDKGKRAKAQPKYQSKKDSKVKWSGRGMTPIWMREEMKGTKLKKDDFLIAR